MNDPLIAADIISERNYDRAFANLENKCNRLQAELAMYKRFYNKYRAVHDAMRLEEHSFNPKDYDNTPY